MKISNLHLTEHYGKISFLGVLLLRSNGKLETTVFRREIYIFIGGLILLLRGKKVY